MGRRGPKPKTHEQMRLAGQRRSGIAKPTCPRTLTFAAKKVWKSYVTPLVDAGLVNALDTLALARYCTLQARLDECDAKIEAEGLTGDYAASGEPGKKSAYVSIHSDISRLLIQLEKELGLTPYARKTMTPAAEPAEQEPAAKYFG